MSSAQWPRTFCEVRTGADPENTVSDWEPDIGTRQGQLIRRYRQDEQPISFTLNGRPCIGRRGDTVLAAILTVSGHLRHTEFSGESRAGFCLIGACQDCFVMTASGRRVRACTTALQAGMSFITNPPDQAENGAGGADD